MCAGHVRIKKTHPAAGSHQRKTKSEPKKTNKGVPVPVALVSFCLLFVTTMFLQSIAQQAMSPGSPHGTDHNVPSLITRQKSQHTWSQHMAKVTMSPVTPHGKGHNVPSLTTWQRSQCPKSHQMVKVTMSPLSPHGKGDNVPSLTRQRL